MKHPRGEQQTSGRISGVLVCVAILAGCAGDSTGTIRLAEDHREPASGQLIRLSNSGDLDERIRAVQAMGRIQTAEYAEALADAVRATEGDLRLEALFALGQLGLAEAARLEAIPRAAVVEATADPDAEIVAAAVEALGKLAGEDAADLIVPLLGHDDPRVRREAAHALFRLRFVPVWRKQSETPPPLPGPAVAGLIATLDDDDVDVRRAATHAFSRYGQEEAIPELAARLRDPDWRVRMFAARALGRSGDGGVAPALVRALGDEDLHVRAESLAALARLERVDALPLALESDPSFHIRAGVARALEQADDEESLTVLRRLGRDPSVTVRAAVVEALAGRLEKDAAPLVERHLGDRAWPIRTAAARAAGKLGSAGPALVSRAMEDPDVRVRVAALASAATLDPTTEAIVEALASPDLALRGSALALYVEHTRPPELGQLVAVYDDSAGPEWVEIREALAEAMAELDDARPALERIAGTDPAPSVRVEARRALGESAADAGELEPPPVATSPWLDRSFASDPVVALETSKGTLVIRGLSAEAPNHVAAFVERVATGFYDGLPWHRVVPNFVIQGGDPRGDGWGGADPPLRDEINRTRFERGILGMPKAGKDTGSCQLFFTHVPTPHLDGNYTVFGVVESGIEVIDEIEVGDEILSARVVNDGSRS